MRILCLFALITIISCEKAEISQSSAIDSMAGNNQLPSPANTFDNQKLLSESKFENGAHPTSGTAKIYEDKDGKRTLVFESFKSDPGPDLRIYIANDKVLSNFTELSSKVENGNKSYAIPSTVDLNKQKFVLIWCKQFSVLFGHAQFK